MDCNLSGSSVHGIFQTIALEWIAISFSSRSSRPRDRSQVSHIVDRRFNHLSPTNCGKFLKRWEYQTTLPVSWETCMWVKKQQLKHCMEQLDWERRTQGCLLPSYLFNLYTQHIMRNARLGELQAEIEIDRRNINKLKYTDTILMAERERN